MFRPRNRHAAIDLRTGFVALFGGWQETSSSLLEVGELFVALPNRYFQFPPEFPASKRYGHTVTKLSTGRILLLGGFAEGGNSLSSSEFFDTAFVNN